MSGHSVCLNPEAQGLFRECRLWSVPRIGGEGNRLMFSVWFQVHACALTLSSNRHHLLAHSTGAAFESNVV
jgi:hypothetical protein